MAGARVGFRVKLKLMFMVKVKVRFRVWVDRSSGHVRPKTSLHYSARGGRGHNPSRVWVRVSVGLELRLGFRLWLGLGPVRVSILVGVLVRVCLSALNKGCTRFARRYVVVCQPRSGVRSVCTLC